MENFDRKILVTGGAGFIGSHVVRRFLTNYPNYLIVNADKLTYAGNLANLSDVEHLPNYRFEKIDIVDAEAVKGAFNKYGITDVIHLAAESHVDRSIEGPMEFVMTNVVGTVNLLHTAKDAWKYMEAWETLVYSPRQLLTTREVLIRHQKLLPIIL